VDQTFAVLVADDPQRQAQKLLRHIVAEYKAEMAAAVAVVDEELMTFAGEVPLARLAALQHLWKAEGKTLRAGQPVSGDGQGVVPLMDGRQLIGLLLIEGGERAEPQAACVVALAAALKAGRDETARFVDLETITDAEIERQRLLVALQRNEWNISRVARLFGVTRRTIYLRLARHNIPRRRVPKTLKECPSGGGEA
jgi:transcriptional regulator of acetoin/glycerol metabolism